MTAAALLLAAFFIAFPVAADAAGQPTPSAYDGHIAAAKGAMVADPDKALAAARSAESLTASITAPRDRTLAIAQAQWLESEALSRLNQQNKAAPIVAHALATTVQLDSGSKLNGNLLLTQAAILRNGGKLPESLTAAQNAYGIFAKIADARSEAKALQFIGSIYLDARDYPKVLRYYAQSAEVFQADPALTVAAYNNIGEALKGMGRFREAEAYYRKGLAVARQVDSPLLEVRILNNLAATDWAGGDLAGADSNADRALSISQKLDSGDQPFLWGVKAQVAYDRHNLPAARTYIAKTFAGVNPQTTPLPYLDFHRAAYHIAQASGDDRLALVHLAAFKRLDDQARELAASANAALVGARFDFANQELRIVNLKAGQLQRDIALERSRTRLHSTILYGTVGTSAVIVIGFLIAYLSIRRSRNEVRAANTTLSQVNGELSEALAAKTRFLATTSHEIRTPLNGILGMTQVMLHDKALPGEQRDRVQIVHDAGTTMKALVDDILDVAKIETGNLSVEHVDVELKPLLAGVARLWADEAAAKGLGFEVVLDDCPARIVSDPRRLRQIVFNLMSNAVKFTETGSIRLDVDCTDEDVSICVIDTGIGIPADQLDRVFESFHQVDGELTRKYGGTGLGLSICRDLAQALGGDVTVRSEPGKGSTFTARLPLGCAREDSPAEDAGWPEALATGSVLVVEGNALARSILSAALGNAAARVRAVGGDEALGAAGEQRVHHIVADLAALETLGGGAQAVAALAASQGGDPVRITLLSTAPPEGEAAEALLGAGAAQILKRPIAVPELVAALERVHDVEHNRAIAA